MINHLLMAPRSAF